MSQAAYISVQRFAKLHGVDHVDPVTAPNAISLAGHASTLAWLAGANPWFAVAGVVADEFDGDSARNLGEESELGSNLDWAIDLGLTTAVAIKLGGVYLLALPLLTLYQAVLRTQGTAPPFGSARAALTCLALA